MDNSPRTRRRTAGSKIVTSTSSGARSSSASAAHGEHLVVDPEARSIAITGTSGFVGHELIKVLEEDPRYKKVIALDVQKPVGEFRKTRYYKVDLTLPTADSDIAEILRAEQVDTFVHAAFLSKPTQNTTWSHELEDIGTMHVMNACAEHRIPKFVMLSTTIVYGPHATNPNFLSEQHELRGHPQSRYVKDKVAAEKQVRRFRQEHPKTVVTVLRLAPMLGPTCDNLVSRFFARPFAPTLMGFDPLIQCLHESDAIDAFKLALDGDFSGEFNIVGDGVLPYSTALAMMGRVPLPMPHFLARSISRALWMAQLFDSPPYFLDFLRYMCVADGTKARSVMGFSPRYDIRRTIQDFIGVLGTTGDGAEGLDGSATRRAR